MNKIGPNTSQTLTDNRSAKASVVTQFKGDRRSVSDAGAPKTSATVALSSQAIDMSALETRIKQLPDLDAARVVELHSRIVAGEYKVDSASIAEKMLSLETSIDS